ncbi:hypothetical protein [Alicyclobacillus sp. ALC3]|uniref:hypothetical protein n=1 Tax=Alicyclobacillus sp. ALC3 TaxID=2796143 RepID=UPI0023795F09|nr:hypothetical protein [Alicyclobacillus sp. ALC3]WDL96016.1 hypothetical protein JC200_16960 [Alicyclobacillus sp. ALC3]
MRRYSKWALAGVVVTTIGVLAGCGSINSHHTSGVKSTNPTIGATNTTTRSISTSGTGNNATAGAPNGAAISNSTSGTTATPTVSFPPLIQQGMQEIKGKTTVPLYAPTTYPGFAHTPLPVTVQTSTTDSPAPGYSVLFNRGNSNIGGFSVSNWETNNAVAQHLLPQNPSLYVQSSVPVMSTLDLGDGIQAKVKRVPAPGKNISALVWTEGRWTMEVQYATNAQSEGVAVAKRIVQYCHANFLPVPHSKGYVLTSLASGIATTYVSWSESQYGFTTTSSGQWNSNLSGGYLSAVEMAVSVTRYH